MKILVIHNFHRKGSASGDDQVYNWETALLTAHGHSVIKYKVSNDEFDNKNIFGKIKLTFGMMWSFANYRNVKRIISEENPDIVHIHTFFPLLSPSVLYAAKRSGKKVVATLHDTRFICPCATSLRGASLCNECMDGKYLRMCKYRCFKDSFVQSLVVACVFKYHKKRRSFYEQIDKYICLNDNQINLLLDAGFERNKIEKKYNFVEDGSSQDLLDSGIDLPSKYVVFYGRIGEEKGIRILMSMWDKITDIPLVVMGSGPLENEFSEWASGKKNVYYLGYTEHGTCISVVRRGEFVVFPSIWYEGCSMVELETQSLGKALIATDLGFSSEAIDDGINGYKIPLNDEDYYIKKIRLLWEDEEMCKKMGKNAREYYCDRYMPEDNYRRLIEIYEN